MAISDRVVRELNLQLNREIYSAYLYLSMAAYFESVGLRGFSKWMKVQWREELMHAMKFFDYIASRGGRVELYAIEAPPKDWKSPLDAFEFALAHEKEVTKRISNLVELAIAEKDHATFNMLQWFVNEQVEEEQSFEEVVLKLKLAGNDTRAILFLDSELGKREVSAENESSGALQD
ncbi:MAG: ferritin [Archaeoglobi archaeon]|jgi:ferritin|nr:ferritin [Archaeoglobales archaeon]TDA26912.1 MAG: ferritin [Archaeoglobi archaeon]TDA27762.1 MAG: ferritin [Archaeoglobi archaeon]